MSLENIKKEFPLHVLVWNNEFAELDTEITENEVSPFSKQLTVDSSFPKL